MKIALAQMRMTEKIAENLACSLRFCDEAADSDLLFFPEIQLTPFFPQYEKRSAAFISRRMCICGRTGTAMMPRCG